MVHNILVKRYTHYDLNIECMAQLANTKRTVNLSVYIIYTYTYSVIMELIVVLFNGGIEIIKKTIYNTREDYTNRYNNYKHITNVIRTVLRTLTAV